MYISLCTYTKENDHNIYASHQRILNQKERSQARKAASRFWSGWCNERGFTIIDMFACCKDAMGIRINSRSSDDKDWTERVNKVEELPRHLELVAKELHAIPVDMPMELNINGIIYRRSDL